MTDRCQNCRFFQDHPWHPDRSVMDQLPDGRWVHRKNYRKVGECRAQPPQRGNAHTLDRDRAVWPIVYGEEWCGQFLQAPGGRR